MARESRACDGLVGAFASAAGVVGGGEEGFAGGGDAGCAGDEIGVEGADYGDGWLCHVDGGEGA